MSTIVILVALALLFNFLNGFNDSSNIVATIIFSRAMAPRAALFLTAIAEFIGPYLFGVAVARTIGEGIITPGMISMEVLLAALISAIFWGLFTWYFGIPSSSLHALVGALIGAVAVSVGWQAILLPGLLKIVAALFLSPVLGLVVGFIFTRLVYFLARNASMRINWFFKNAQVLTGLGLGLSHGANDAQKAMGVITLGLVTCGYLDSFTVPMWVLTASAGAMALGTSIGGWRLIKTLGSKFYKIRPVNGFCTQISSASVILGAALLGGPVSTTHVVSSTILGVGAAERLNKVRWTVVKGILITWVLTMPATACVAALVYFIIR